MQRIVLVNPNTSEPLTALMAEIARENAPACFRIDGLTARFGAPLLTNEADLDEAARALRALGPELAQSADAVIVSAFGDPGADELAALLERPVVESPRPACALLVEPLARIRVSRHPMPGNIDPTRYPNAVLL